MVKKEKKKHNHTEEVLNKLIELVETDQDSKKGRGTVTPRQWQANDAGDKRRQVFQWKNWQLICTYEER